MKKPLALLAGFLLLSALATGCGGPGLRVPGRFNPVPPDRIIDLKSGREINVQTLVRELSTARIVVLGEYHQHPGQHRNQLAILEGLRALNPRMLVGVEIISKSQQSLLNDWVEGRIPEKEFENLVAGRMLRPETFAVYYPLFRWARNHKIKLLALDIPRSLAGKIARQGLAALTSQERQMAAREIRVGPPAYRKRVLRVFSAHRALPNQDLFFKAQVVRDETMAETLVDYLKSPEGLNLSAVVITGNEHVIGGHGIPDRAARRMNGKVLSVLMLLNVEDKRLAASDADYVWVTGPAPKRKRLRLGVRLARDASGSLSIRSVVPGSEAERIGLKPGDRLVTLNGHPIKTFMDFHNAAVKGGTKRLHQLTVKRNGRLMTFPFRFQRE